jgi:archaellum component FlaC
MKDRRKQIAELEQYKKDQSALLDSLFVGFGEALLGRMDVSSHAEADTFDELATFRSFKGAIAASEASIQNVEEQMRRFKELEKNIETKEREENACLKDLTIVCGGLGKLLLDAASTRSSGNYADFCTPWKDQAGTLLTKIVSLEDRISGLEQKEEGNVFTWIGKGAQTLVLRSFLTKAQENLEQLRQNVGESYSLHDKSSFPYHDEQAVLAQDDEIVEVCASIETKRAEQRELSQDLQTLKDEKKRISTSFNAEGDPPKQIQNLRNHISNARNDMKVLYRRLGDSAAQSDADIESGAQAERRQFIASFVTLDDQEIIDRAAQIGKSIRDTETSIEKLKAAIAIDDEKARIEKFRRMIQDKKDKIAQAEKNIAEFEANIKDCEASIEKLKKL